MKKKAIIIGCGLTGITSATLLKRKGYNVSIYESRSHIGGNCYDSKIDNTLVHMYGPHIFHTNDDEVFNFLSKFTEWIPFYNRPIGNTKLGKISLPYSKKTIKEIGRELTQEEIIDVIFKDYSEKQWGIPFDQLPSAITNRIPKVKDADDPTWYEGEKYQCMPKQGYTKMFEKMLDGINVYLNCKKNEWKSHKADLYVYTGKIDEYFKYCYGPLKYRSLDFKHKVKKTKMPYAIENQNNKKKYTRIYDNSHFSQNHEGSTVVSKEYPKNCKEDDIPFYPMNWGEQEVLYKKYKKLADLESNVIFLGRLACYRYLDMWMAVKQAINKLK